MNFIGNRKVIIVFVFIIGVTFGTIFTSNTNVFVPEQLKAASPEVNFQSSQMQQTIDFVDIVKKVRPAVVIIEVTKKVKISQQIPDIFERFFDQNPNFQIPEGEQERRGLGSGFLVSSNGYILTNNHVIKNVDEINVKLPDKRVFEDAEIIGKDPLTDVALIKIDGENLPYVELGNSDNLQVGEWVIAVGSPFSDVLSSTVTAGIVSAVGRNLSIIGQSQEMRSYAIENFIQTDAAINPGNSGGPLVNKEGKVVGVNTAIISRTGVYQGYGFSIPINLAKKVMEELKEYGEMRRGYMGVSIQSISYKDMKALNLDSSEGALVAGVSEGGGAREAGIREGDVIVELDGKQVDRPNQLQSMLVGKHPGDEVRVTVLREGKRRVFTVTLKEREKAAEGQISSTVEPEKMNLGLSVDNLDNYNVSDRFLERYDGGVIITKVESNSVAEESGLYEGDIIWKIGRDNIQNVQDFKNTISKYRGQFVMFYIVRRGSSLLISVRIP